MADLSKEEADALIKLGDYVIDKYNDGFFSFISECDSDLVKSALAKLKAVDNGNDKK